MGDTRRGRTFRADCRNGEVQRLVDNGFKMHELMRRYDLSRSTINRAMSDFKIVKPEGFYIMSHALKTEIVESEARSLALSGKW